MKKRAETRIGDTSARIGGAKTAHGMRRLLAGL